VKLVLVIALHALSFTPHDHKYSICVKFYVVPALPEGLEFVYGLAYDLLGTGKRFPMAFSKLVQLLVARSEPVHERTFHWLGRLLPDLPGLGGPTVGMQALKF